MITTLGTAGSAISSNTGNEIANYLVQQHVYLDENDVPEENRWCVAPPQFYEID